MLRRRGFTLVELLVAVSIIGILFALLLPALQSIRESARRAVCLNRLKQIGLAMHGYLDSYERFPPGYVSGVQDVCQEDSGPGWSWGPRIMPWMERAALAARVDFALPMTDAKMRPVLLESLPDFVCPADDEFQRLTPVPHKKTDVLLATIASANYVASSGTFRLSCGACRDYFDGMFGRNKAVRPSEVEDGLSQTLAAGERAFKWSSPVIWGNVPESKLVDRQVPRKFAAGPGYVLGTTFAVGFNVPTPIYDVNEQDSSAEGFGSRHLGGANFVFCDGSARFMRNETMDPAVFNSLSTRAGGAVTTDLLLTGGEE